jgi:hypothetical protein
MLKVFEESGIKDSNFDCLTFMPSEDDNVKIEAGQIEHKGEKVGGSALGDSYQILLFKENEEGDPTEIDQFNAILGCPLEYASFLIPAGWYGLIMKHTTTSPEIVEDLLGRIRSYA